MADLLLGARMLNLKQNLGWTFNGNLGPIPLLNRAGSTDLSFTNWDAIVGVKGRVRFGDGGRWYLPYYADIGTGQSKLTWQAMAGIGYSWSSIELLAVWRYLDYDFKSSSQVDSLTLNGPADRHRVHLVGGEMRGTETIHHHRCGACRERAGRVHDRRSVHAAARTAGRAGRGESRQVRVGLPGRPPAK